MAERNPEGHNPSWWAQHPTAKAKALLEQESKTSLPHPTVVLSASLRDRHLAYLRATGFVSFALAIGAILMEDYFWWFVVFFYIGLAIAVVDCATDVSLGKPRYALVVFFLLLIVGFTLIVRGGVKPRLKAQWTTGNYAEGTDVQGLAWKKDWSDLRVFVVNDGNVDLKDVDVEFDVGVPVAAVKQIGDVCLLTGGGITDVIGTDNSTGLQIHFPLGPSKHPYRILCSKLPAGLGVQVVVAVVNEDQSDLTRQRPKEVHFRARYKARMRPYDLTSSVAPSDWGAN
jgi:hypothetical protein